MDLFPVELWEHIFRESDILDCLSLLTVCRLFYILVRPKVYKEIRVYRNLHDIDGYYENWNTLQLLNALAARPELYGLVHTLRLHSELREVRAVFEEVVAEKNSLHPILPQLSSFVGLRVLDLKGIHIDADCHAAIHSLPCLEHVKVTTCDIDLDLWEIPLHPTRRNGISELSIVDPKSERWGAIASPGGLLSLNIDTRSKPRLVSDSILQNLALYGVPNYLTKLEWTLGGGYLPASLLRFLEMCTQIQTLSLMATGSIALTSHVENLLPGAIPMLANYRGPPEYTEVLLRGRPVHNVSLQVKGDTPTDVLRALWLSSVPITTLELLTFPENTLGPNVGLLLEYAPPTLRHLHVNQHLYEEQVVTQSWIPAFSRITTLRTLTFDRFQTFGVSLQKDIVQRLSEECNSVREINFGQSDRWVWRNDCSWEHYPSRNKKSIYRTDAPTPWPRSRPPSTPELDF